MLKNPLRVPLDNYYTAYYENKSKNEQYELTIKKLCCKYIQQQNRNLSIFIKNATLVELMTIFCQALLFKLKTEKNSYILR